MRSSASPLCTTFSLLIIAGADQGFFVRNFCRPFFRPNCFFLSRSKKAFSGTFWKIMTKKCVFQRALPLKISIYWRQRHLYKNVKVCHQKWIFQNSTKGDPLGRQGERAPKKEKRHPPPPPHLNLPLNHSVLHCTDGLWLAKG